MQQIPIQNLSFSAYRPAFRDGSHGQRSIFLSLAHWFEAERFRAFAPELYAQVLHQPTIKEARNFAKRHLNQTRGDWMAVRARALACGMVYAYWADQDHPRWSTDPETLVSHLAPLGIAERITAEAAAEFLRLRSAARIVFLGAAASSPEAVGKRVHQVNKRASGAWQLTYWQGRHSCWQIHDWAIQQFIPVRYLGQDNDRLKPDRLSDLIAHADQAVVFEARGGKRMDAVIRALKASKLPLEIDFYNRQEPFASLLE